MTATPSSGARVPRRPLPDDGAIRALRDVARAPAQSRNQLWRRRCTSRSARRRCAAGVCGARGRPTASRRRTAATATASPRAREPERMFAELLGRCDGYCKGRAGSMHIADPATGILGANGDRRRRASRSPSARRSPPQCSASDGVAVAFFGEGAVAEGAFHEALNLAALWTLPVVLRLREQPATPSSRPSAVHARAREVAALAAPLRHRRACRSTATTSLAVAGAAAEAVARARAGDGPTLLECDDLPLERATTRATRALPHEEEVDGVAGARPDRALARRARGARRRRRALAADRRRGSSARSRPPPSARAAARRDAGALARRRLRERRGRMRELKYREAISEAIAEEMERDPTRRPVRRGRRRAPAARSSRPAGCSTASARTRVRDTPISEGALVGVGDRRRDDGAPADRRDHVLRLPHARRRPARQPRREGALRLGGRVRRADGRCARSAAPGGAAGPQHGAEPGGWIAHVPGLKVVLPSNAGRREGAAQVGDPRSRPGRRHREPRGLERCAARCRTATHLVPIGEAAAVAREGERRDARLVGRRGASDARGGRAARAPSAASPPRCSTCARSARWTSGAILRSLAKTGRLVIVHDAVGPFGGGAEVAAIAATRGLRLAAGAGARRITRRSRRCRFRTSSRTPTTRRQRTSPPGRSTCSPAARCPRRAR